MENIVLIKKINLIFVDIEKIYKNIQHSNRLQVTLDTHSSNAHIQFLIFFFSPYRHRQQQHNGNYRNKHSIVLQFQTVHFLFIPNTQI